MQVASVERIHLDKAIQLFDLINVANYNNFIVKGKKADYVSHNCGIMDEINFSAGPANAKLAANAMMKTYRAVKSRMKSRFISSGRPLPTILWMISSKKSENDFLEQYAKEVKDDPSTYIVDEPIWNVKPKGTYSTKTFKVAVGNKFLASKMIGDDEDVDSYIKQGYKIVDVPVDFKADFKKDVDGALMDIAGISASSSLKYLSVETMMETMLPDKNPFTTEILNIGTKDKLRIQDFFLPNLIKEKQFSKPIYIHIDMSQSGDKTGIAAIAIEGAKRIDENDPDAQPELYYRMLFGVDIKNPTDAQVDFAKTRQFIYYLKGLGWNIKCVSTDGFQSTDTQQRIAEHGINAKVLSLDRTPIGYEVLKSAINDKRVGLLNIEQLKKEAAEIQRDMKTGKIDHPENGSKDLLDAVAGALWSASMDKDSYVYQHGEDLLTSLEINMTPADSKMQVMKDLHDMLAQDAEKAKEDAAKVLKRAEEKKLVNLTNMTEEQKQAYTNQTMLDADDDDDVYTPSRLDDSIILF